MPTILEYTKGIVIQADTGRTFNPQAIDQAGSTMSGVAAVADYGAELALKHEIANETTAVNDLIIQKQKEDMEWLETTRKQREGNPFGFTKDIEKEMVKRDQERAKLLPSERAKKAYLESTKRINLGEYESNFKWENNRKTQIYAERIDRSLDNLNTMAYRAGQEGKDIEDLTKNADATMVSAGSFAAPEKVGELRTRAKAKILSSYLEGTLETDPYKAKELLDSKKYDDLLGAEGLQSAYDKTTRQIEAFEKKKEEAWELGSFIGGEKYANPENKNHVRAVNNAFVDSGLIDGVANGDQQAISETLEIIKSTSIVPKGVQSIVKGYIDSGSDEQKQIAYSIIGGVEATNTSALMGKNGFTKSDIEEATVYNSLIRSGADSKFALSVVNNSKNPMNEAINKERSSRADKALKNLTPAKIKENFDEGFFDLEPNFQNVEAEDKILTNYKNLYRQAYIQYGNEEAAKGVAVNAIKAVNGVSYVSGKKVVTELPPEDFYGLPSLTKEENAEWIREELKQDLSMDDVSDVVLVPSMDSHNRINAGQKPLYHAMITKEENGFPVIDYVRGKDNMPVKIGFDTEKKLDVLNKQEKEYAKNKRIGNIMKRQISMEDMPFLGEYLGKWAVDLDTLQKNKNIKEKIEKQEERFFKPKDGKQSTVQGLTFLK